MKNLSDHQTVVALSDDKTHFKSAKNLNTYKQYTCRLSLGLPIKKKFKTFGNVFFSDWCDSTVDT